MEFEFTFIRILSTIIEKWTDNIIQLDIWIVYSEHQ